VLDSQCSHRRSQFSFSWHFFLGGLAHFPGSVACLSKEFADRWEAPSCSLDCKSKKHICVHTYCHTRTPRRTHAQTKHFCKTTHKWLNEAAPQRRRNRSALRLKMRRPQPLQKKSRLQKRAVCTGRVRMTGGRQKWGAAQPSQYLPPCSTQ